MSKKLSPREAEVALLLAAGLSAREVAVALGLSASTVRTVTSTVYCKLGVHNRAQLCGKLAERGQRLPLPADKMPA